MMALLVNYTNAFLKYLKHNPLASCLNILCMSIGLTAYSVIGFYIVSENTYETHWIDSENIYRIYTDIDLGGNNFQLNTASYPLLPTLTQLMGADIQAVTRRIVMGNSILFGGNERYSTTINLVDEEFLDIFKFEIVDGDLSRIFENINNIAISEDLLFIFNNENPINKTLQVNLGSGETVDYRVVAVYRIPGNTKLINYTTLAQLDAGSKLIPPQAINRWMPSGVSYFVKFKDGTDIGFQEEQIARYLNANVSIPPLNVSANEVLSDKIQFRFQKITDAYLNPLPGEQGINGRKLIILAALSVVILGICTSNFIIQNIGSALKRRTTYVIRMVLGADRAELCKSLFVESAIILIFSSIVVVALSSLFVPYLKSIFAIEYNLIFDSYILTYFILSAFLLLTICLIGGLLPVYYLYRNNIINVMRGLTFDGSMKVRSIYDFFIFFQFAFVTILLSLSMIFKSQIDLLTERNLGFNPDNLLSMNISSPDAKERLDVLVNQLESSEPVSALTLTSRQPNRLAGEIPYSLTYQLVSSDGVSRKDVELESLSVGQDFFRTFGINILYGRPYTINDETQGNGGTALIPTIINEEAANRFGFSDPMAALGAPIQTEKQNGNTTTPYTYQIIGVAENNNFTSVKSEVVPTIYQLEPSFANFLTFRYEQNALPEIVDEAGQIWRTLFPDIQPDFNYINENISQTLSEDRKFNAMLGLGGLIVILLAVISLFLVVAFKLSVARKEITIRKIFGGRKADILLRLLLEYAKPVLLSFIASWPIAIWFGIRWIRQFPYHLELNALVFCCITAGIISISIFLFTVISISSKTVAEPVCRHLRYE